MNPVITLGLIGTDIKKYLITTFAIVLLVITMPVIAVISLGDEVLSFLGGSPSAQAAEEQGFYMGGPIPGNTYIWGNCTYWAFAMRYWADKPISTTWGNANTWDENAIYDGYLVDHTPIVGAVMQSDEGLWGHVAYVVDVNIETGQWKISEMNAPNLNVVSTRTFNNSAAQYYDFIHDKKVFAL
jgi:surface antigen